MSATQSVQNVEDVLSILHSLPETLATELSIDGSLEKLNETINFLSKEFLRCEQNKVETEYLIETIISPIQHCCENIFRSYGAQMHSTDKLEGIGTRLITLLLFGRDYSDNTSNIWIKEFLRTYQIETLLIKTLGYGYQFFTINILRILHVQMATCCWSTCQQSSSSSIRSNVHEDKEIIMKVMQFYQQHDDSEHLESLIAVIINLISVNSRYFHEFCHDITFFNLILHHTLEYIPSSKRTWNMNLSLLIKLCRSKEFLKNLKIAIQTHQHPRLLELIANAQHDSSTLFHDIVETFVNLDDQLLIPKESEDSSDLTLGELYDSTLLKIFIKYQANAEYATRVMELLNITDSYKSCCEGFILLLRKHQEYTDSLQSVTTKSMHGIVGERPFVRIAFREFPELCPLIIDVIKFHMLNHDLAKSLIDFIGTLCEKDNWFINPFLQCEGCCQIIMKCLVKHFHSVQMIVAVCNAIDALIIDSQGRALIRKVPSGCKLLFSSLSQHLNDPQSVKSLCYSMTHLCLRDVELKRAFGDVKGSESVIITACKKYVTDPMVFETISVLVGEYAHYERNGQLIFRSGNGTYLDWLLQTWEEHMQGNNIDKKFCRSFIIQLKGLMPLESKEFLHCKVVSLIFKTLKLFHLESDVIQEVLQLLLGNSPQSLIPRLFCTNKQQLKFLFSIFRNHCNQDWILDHWKQFMFLFLNNQEEARRNFVSSEGSVEYAVQLLKRMVANQSKYFSIPLHLIACCILYNNDNMQRFLNYENAMESLIGTFPLHGKEDQDAFELLLKCLTELISKPSRGEKLLQFPNLIDLTLHAWAKIDKTVDAYDSESMIQQIRSLVTGLSRVKVVLSPLYNWTISSEGCSIMKEHFQTQDTSSFAIALTVDIINIVSESKSHFQRMLPEFVQVLRKCETSQDRDLFVGLLFFITEAMNPKIEVANDDIYYLLSVMDKLSETFQEQLLQVLTNLLYMNKRSTEWESTQSPFITNELWLRCYQTLCKVAIKFANVSIDVDIMCNMGLCCQIIRTVVSLHPHRKEVFAPLVPVLSKYITTNTRARNHGPLLTVLSLSNTLMDTFADELRFMDILCGLIDTINAGSSSSAGGISDPLMSFIIHLKFIKMDSNKLESRPAYCSKLMKYLKGFAHNFMVGLMTIKIILRMCTVDSSRTQWFLELPDILDVMLGLLGNLYLKQHLMDSINEDEVQDVHNLVKTLVTDGLLSDTMKSFYTVKHNTQTCHDIFFKMVDFHLNREKSEAALVTLMMDGIVGLLMLLNNKELKAQLFHNEDWIAFMLTLLKDYKHNAECVHNVLGTLNICNDAGKLIYDEDQQSFISVDSLTGQIATSFSRFPFFDLVLDIGLQYATMPDCNNVILECCKCLSFCIVKKENMQQLHTFFVKAFETFQASPIIFFSLVNMFSMTALNCAETIPWIIDCVQVIRHSIDQFKETLTCNLVVFPYAMLHIACINVNLLLEGMPDCWNICFEGLKTYPENEKLIRPLLKVLFHIWRRIFKDTTGTVTGTATGTWTFLTLPIEKKCEQLALFANILSHGNNESAADMSKQTIPMLADMVQNIRPLPKSTANILQITISGMIKSYGSHEVDTSLIEKSLEILNVLRDQANQGGESVRNQNSIGCELELLPVLIKRIITLTESDHQTHSLEKFQSTLTLLLDRVTLLHGNGVIIDGLFRLSDSSASIDLSQLLPILIQILHNKTCTSPLVMKQICITARYLYSNNRGTVKLVNPLDNVKLLIATVQRSLDSNNETSDLQIELLLSLIKCIVYDIIHQEEELVMQEALSLVEHLGKMISQWFTQIYVFSGITELIIDMCMLLQHLIQHTTGANVNLCSDAWIMDFIRSLLSLIPPSKDHSLLLMTLCSTLSICCQRCNQIQSLVETIVNEKEDKIGFSIEQLLNLLMFYEQNVKVVESICQLLMTWFNVKPSVVSQVLVDKHVDVLLGIWFCHRSNGSICKHVCSLLLQLSKQGLQVKEIWKEKCAKLLQATTDRFSNDGELVKCVKDLQGTGIFSLSPNITNAISWMLQQADQQIEKVQQISGIVNPIVSLEQISVPTVHMIPNQEIEIGSGIDVNLLQGTWKLTSVVLKLAPVSLIYATKHESKQAWQQELEVLSKLRHPRIVTLFGCCHLELPSNDPLASQIQIRTALVLEHMTKGNLRTLLNCEYATLNVLEKVRIALDISEGMRFLHESDLYHRDLKSIYVLIDGDNRAKLTGFGGGEREEGWCDASKGNYNKTPSTHMESTSFPEKKMSVNSAVEKLHRKQVDIGAFGLILWEMLTGNVPKMQTIASGSKVRKNKLSNNTANRGTGYKLTLIEEETKKYPPELTRLIQQCSMLHDQSVSSKFDDFGAIYDALHDIWIEEIKRIKDRTKLVPDGFLCPITQDVMKDPVILIDGHSYERKAIVDWLKRSNRSPLTNEELPMMSKDSTMPLMVDNYALKSAISNYLDSSGNKTD